jgi:hypothetical protein
VLSPKPAEPVPRGKNVVELVSSVSQTDNCAGKVEKALIDADLLTQKF